MPTFLVGFDSNTTSNILSPARTYETIKLDTTSNGNILAQGRLLIEDGDVLTKIWFRGKASSGGTTGTCTAAAYVTNSGTNIAGARASSIATISTTSSTEALRSVTLNESLSAYVGQYIKPAGGYSTNYRPSIGTPAGAAGDAYYNNGGNCPNPLSAVSSADFFACIYLEIERASFSINSTNSGANDLNAGAVNTASVTGYVVGVNPVVSGTVGSLALTSVSQSGGVVSATIPAPVNDSYWPEPDASHLLTFTDGSNPATFNAVMNSLAGYTSIVLASPDLADMHKIPYWLTSTAEDDDRIMYKTADMTVAADGGISGATLGATTIYYHWRVADSKIFAYEALLDEEGIATSTGLTVRGLSVSGLTVRGLTVRGLGGAAAMAGGFPYLLPFLLS